VIWVFGPFQGIVLDVANIDPIVLDAKYQMEKKRSSVIGKKKGNSTPSREKTVLSLLVEGQNTELLNDKYIQALLDTKWEVYARDELMNRLFQTILMIACLMEAQVVPITEDERLLIAFHIPKSFESPMEITRNIVFFFFLGKFLRFFFSDPTGDLADVQARMNIHLFGCASGLKWANTGATQPAKGRILENSKLAEALARKTEFTEQEWESFGIKYLSKDAYIQSGAGGSYFKPEVGAMFRHREERVQEYIILFIFGLFGPLIHSILENMLGPILAGILAHMLIVYIMAYLLSRVDLSHVFKDAQDEIENMDVSFWVACALTIGADCGMAMGFLGMSFQEFLALGRTAAIEFSLWQSIVFLYVVPWALILSRSRDQRKQVKKYCSNWIICCAVLICIFPLVFAEKKTKSQHDAARGDEKSKGAFDFIWDFIWDAIQRVVFDDVLDQKRHENNKERYNACVGYNM
jgi:hypothetical protein